MGSRSAISFDGRQCKRAVGVSPPGRSALHADVQRHHARRWLCTSTWSGNSAACIIALQLLLRRMHAIDSAR